MRVLDQILKYITPTPPRVLLPMQALEATLSLKRRRFLGQQVIVPLHKAMVATACT